MKSDRLRRLLASLVLVSACGDDATNAGDTTPLADTTSLAEPDTSAAVDTATSEDSATEGSPDSATPDDAAPDALDEPDTGEPAGPTPPLARVYANNPLDGSLIEVELPHIQSHDGKLTGAFARVWNCTQAPGGKKVNYQGVTLTLCNQEQTALRGDDGTWLHVDPPASDKDGNDAFAELMMYWHVNHIHDWFKDSFGMSSLDFSMDALVNVQFSIYGGWLPFDNAAFIPKESLAQLGLPLDLNGDSIIFGQGTNVDFSYEADVIYHEYTHAMIGTTRLMGVTLDAYGPTNLPSAMNEGFADYFAATLADDPLMGAYALSNVSSIFTSAPPMDLSRDLSVMKRCPDDLTTEFHADGEIVGSAMWSIRAQLGPAAADAIILKAIQTFTNATTIDGASEAIIEEAGKLDPPRDAEVEQILRDHGMLGCNRVMPYKAFLATGGDSLPLEIPGTSTTGLPQFFKWVPGFVQWRYTQPTGKAGFSIMLKIAAGGVGGFGGGSLPTLSLLAKRGGQPITYAYAGATTTHDAEVEIPLVQGKSDAQGLTPYTATVFGDCVAEGDVVLQIKNTSKTGGQIYALQISALTEAPDGDPTFGGCGGP
ncbi:MAG: hypothetical protein AMXMBFR64_24030 [Myxococcales bacterium]